MRIRQTPVIIAIVLIVLLGLAAMRFVIVTDEKLEAAQNRIADLERRLAKQAEQEAASLADAMQLLPADSMVTGGSRLSGELYWVSAETLDKDGRIIVQLWAADVPAGTATLIVQRDLSGADVVMSVDSSSIGDEYVTIESQASTDVGTEIYMDAVDSRTGHALASVRWENGSRISVQKDGKTLELSLPSDICKGKTAGETVDVTGVVAQGVLVRLPQASSVECIEDAFANTIRPADLGIPFYVRSRESGKETVEFSLPWGDLASIDALDLRPAGVSFEAD